MLFVVIRVTKLIVCASDLMEDVLLLLKASLRESKGPESILFICDEDEIIF